MELVLIDVSDAHMHLASRVGHRPLVAVRGPAIWLQDGAVDLEQGSSLCGKDGPVGDPSRCRHAPSLLR